ncbi:DUF3037 domain-containing protein [Ureibacillus thermosphaericus]|uniref:DUF3037 domain-containing protein n=1 Tax=Ureibacillus thermosphaericus TaxID=51173 RepID=A0A840PV57_URETH|nr:DUF3037 domain-containing protein [Ureibacillus thermosphaericus]MBB5148612.1 hypothetical protein [Ureibacillus thermosphaericus]NKZ31329.1 DUF3037 domain-containing protein [Ureibacillus thermosphaericus]
MEDKVFFSIAKYVPDLLRDEKINFGFAYYYPSERKLGYLPSKNVNRIQSFDDELDKETISMLQADLEYEFSIDTLDNDEDDEILQNLLMKNDNSILLYKTKNFVNQIQFTDIHSIIVDESLEKTLNDLSDIYLYYDRSIKERRMDKERIKSLTKKIIKSNFGKDFYSNINANINNKLSFNKEPYDFKVNIKNEIKYIKALSFDYKKYYKLYDELKIFLFDLQRTINNNHEISNKNFIVVINNTDFEQEFEQIAKDILEKEVTLYTIEEFNNVIQKETVFS